MGRWIRALLGEETEGFLSSQGSVSRARVQRRALTTPEARLWVYLCRRGLDDLKFRCPHPTGPYVLDFRCAQAKLAVEVDGASHDHPDRAENDLVLSCLSFIVEEAAEVGSLKGSAPA